MAGRGLSNGLTVRWRSPRLVSPDVQQLDLCQGHEPRGRVGGMGGPGPHIDVVVRRGMAVEQDFDLAALTRTDETQWPCSGSARALCRSR